MRTRSIAVALLLTGLLAGCTSGPPPVPETSGHAETPPTDPGVAPVGQATVIASGLAAPWSMVRLPSGSTLISERDTGIVKELEADGAVREVATIAGVDHNGEGGLLGLEVADGSLFAYFTTGTDNRVERFPLLGDAGSYRLGDGTVILDGLKRAGNHNGGRIKVGPDGDLYVTVGDAGDSANAQDLDSLNGKILRIELDGGIPADNPFPGSPIYSYGHRNPQGLAWDANGQLWAAEFGQNTWDELNVIEKGGDYGWPLVEGIGTDPKFKNPVLQWGTNDASPSGLVFTQGTFFMAALRGERIWAIHPHDPIGNVPWFVGEFGRIRDVVEGPNGTLWFLTNNTDGRGDPKEGDDKLVQFRLETAVEG
ncbi:MAG: PQQ-dependent sugar dehydrogenase [Rhodoglobus sp.]